MQLTLPIFSVGDPPTVNILSYILPSFSLAGGSSAHCRRIGCVFPALGIPQWV